MRPHGFVQICGHDIMLFRARIFAMRPQGGIGVPVYEGPMTAQATKTHEPRGF